MKKSFKTLWKRLLACILVITITLSSFDVTALATAVENTEYTAADETGTTTEETGAVTGTVEGTTTGEQTDSTVPENGTDTTENEGTEMVKLFCNTNRTISSLFYFEYLFSNGVR